MRCESKKEGGREGGREGRRKGAREGGGEGGRVRNERGLFITATINIKTDLILFL